MNEKIDVLAQEIRSVDGRHSIGAAGLAEALMPFIEREFIPRAAVAELIEAQRQIKYSIQQARIPGNDWKRELSLIENIVDAVLARIDTA